MGVIKLKNINEEAVEETAANEQAYSETETVELAEQWEDPAVLSEDETRITENSRHYILNNGTAKSVISGSPMNYYDEEKKKWETIDNSLTEKADVFEAKCGKFRTEISKTEKGKSVKLSGKDIALSWEYLGKKPETASFMPMNDEGMSLTTEEKPQTVLNVRQKIKGVEKTFGGEAVYENIEKNTDLEYKLQGNNIKENIIVKEKAEEYKYLFALNTEGLKLRLSEDNTSIELYSETVTENGETEEKKEFMIPSPYMYDANGEMSEEVYYELEPAEDGKYVFAVVAGEEWINAPERAFPVTIDPQIVSKNDVSFLSYVNYVTPKSSSGTSSSGTTPWTYSDSTFMEAGETSYQYKKSWISINKSKIVLLYKNILSAKLKLKPYKYISGYVQLNDKNVFINSGNEVTVDITARFKNSQTMYFEPSGSSGGYVSFYTSGENAPVLEIEYITNENVKPTKKTVSLAGGAVNGDLDVRSGELVSEFADIDESGALLGVNISHAYKKDATDFNVGKNFRLNLHEKFEKNSSGTMEADYVYTDGEGIKHAFKDFYYYLNSAKQKVYVEKTKVSIDQDQVLSYTTGEKTYRIYKEQRTSSGLQAITVLSDFQNCDLIEQRQDEYKQAVEQVDSYRNALNDFVVISDAGELLYSCKEYIDTNEKFNQFCTYTDSASRLLMSESESINYRSLLEQEKSLTSQKESLETQKTALINQKVALNDQEIALEHQKKSLELSGDSTGYQIASMNNTQAIEDNEETQKTYKNVAYQNTINSYIKNNLSLQQSNINAQVTDTQKSIAQTEAQKETTQAQIDQAGDQTEIIDEQLELIGYQIKALKDKKAYYKELLQKYYKEYYNYNHQKKLMERQVPVNYLTDGTIYKGFNEYGELVVIYDGYDNTVAIEYEDYDLTESGEAYRICALSDNEENRITFDYNDEGLLTSITDKRGRKTKYTYDGSRYLTKVEYADGKTIHIGYNGTDINSIESSDKFRSEMTYASSKLTAVKTYSLTTEIARDGANSVSGSDSTMIEQRLISYSSSTKTVITLREKSGVISDGNKSENIREHYIFNADGNNTEYYLEEYGKVTKAEKYEYKAYISERTDYAQKSRLNVSAYTDGFEFGTTDYEETVFDEFNNPKTSTKYNYISAANSVSAVTSYTYDDNHKCEKTSTVTTVTTPNGNKTYTGIIKYNYNAQGKVVRAESYIEGEERTKGKTVEETFYDKNGNVKKSYTYNSLDSTTKTYTESEYGENGRLLADFDETGTNKTEYDYIDGSEMLRSKKLPNGSKFTYDYDADDSVTSITQSTEEGEENSTRTLYTCGEVTGLISGNNKVEYTYDYKRRLTAIGYNGNAAYETYEYTEGVTEDTVKVINALEETFTTVSDKRGNVIRTLTGETQQSASSYNSEGKATQYTDNVTGAVVNYTYDPTDGKLLKAERLNAGELTETLTYTGYNEVEQRTLTGEVNQAYTYTYKDTAERELEKIALPNGLYYYPQRDVTERNTGKELKTSDGERKAGEYIFYRKVGDHATGMPSAIYFGGIKNGAYEIRDNMKYSYDESGNICKITENGELYTRYAYDGLNRLVREDNKKLGKTYLYSYDNNGNILSRKQTSFTLREDVEACVFTADEYGYDGDRLMSYGNEAFEYDAIGNPTKYRGLALTWEKGRQLAKIGEIELKYDANGRRVKRGDVEFVYDDSGNLVKSDGMEFYYDEGGVSGVKYKNKQYVYRKDAQGNTVALLDEAYQVVVKYIYDGWGNAKALDASGAEITDGEHIGLKNPFRYRGYYYDEALDLYYLQTRYYDAEVGRFINIDGIEYLDPETINGLNLYAYCGNNPVMFTDPDGTLKWWQKLLIGVAFIVVGAVATALSGGAFLGAVVCGLTVAAKAAVVGAAVGLVTGGISAAINGGNILQGMLQGAFNGAVDGFMWGGITAGLTNIVKPGTLCFAAGTKVLAENGQRNIEDIKVGDRVLAYNEQTGEQEYKKVVRLFRNESKDWTGITVNGEEIISTPGHKYYIPESKKWVSAKDLKKGNIVLLSNGERTEVESVRSIHYEEAHTTYNFEVEDFHTYYVGTGVLVHNANCGFNSKTVSGPEKVGRYKNVRIDVEMNPVGKVDIHMQAKNLPKMHYSNGGFPTAPNKLANSDFAKKGIIKALDYVKRMGWKL